MFYLILIIGTFALFSAAFANKQARKTGHNSNLWAAIGAIAFIAAHFLVSFAIGFSFLALWGSEVVESEVLRLISIIAFFMTVVATNLLIFWYLKSTSKKSFKKSFDEPPQPPTFESGEN